MDGKKKPPRRHLKVIYPNSAGIDVGAKELWVAVPADSLDESVRCFGTFTDDLHALRDWLKSVGITTVAMESTGIYWIPLYDVLSVSGIEVFLVNPREIKQVPGRKSDVRDCQWIQELHSLGLLRAAFRPDDAACEIRGLIRQRQELIKSSVWQVHHMQKALLQMNIQLPQVVSDIAGSTGLAIIRDIVSGERDPLKLAQHRDCRCKKDEATIARSLCGNWRKEHVLSLSQALRLWDFYRTLIGEIEKAIFESIDDRLQEYSFPQETEVPKTQRRKNRSKSNYTVPIEELWHRKVGVDLTAIEGISGVSASIILAEVGLNIDRFPTAGRFASWLGLCPIHDVSGGKVLRRGTKKTANRVASALRMAASTVMKSQTWLGAFYRRIAGRSGAAVAITATAHKMARLVYALLRYGTAYVQQSVAEYEKTHQEQLRRNLQKRAKLLGLQLIPVDELAVTV